MITQANQCWDKICRRREYKEAIKENGQHWTVLLTVMTKLLFIGLRILLNAFQYHSNSTRHNLVKGGFTVPFPWQIFCACLWYFWNCNWVIYLGWGPQSHSEQLFIGRDRQGRLMLHNETSAASETNNQGITVEIYRTKWELDVLELHTHTHTNVPDDPNTVKRKDWSPAYSKPAIIKAYGAPQMLWISVSI